MVLYNLFDHVDSNFRTIICFHIGWQGTSVYLSNDTDNPDLTISSATQNSLNENTYRAKSFSESLLISQLIFSWVVNDNIVSVIKFVCLFQFWMTLCQAHSVPIQWKPSYLSFFVVRIFGQLRQLCTYYYLPLLYKTSLWNVFQTNIPWLINVFYQIKTGVSILIRVTVF